MPEKQSRFYVFFLIFFVCASVFFGACFFVIHNYLIDFSSIAWSSSSEPSIVFDDEGNEWARFWMDKREPVELEVMPQHLINAFIASEDRDFFMHHGISWRGIVRSVFVNLYKGRRAQGASTITQQLVKLLFFDCKKTFTRKIKEQILSVLVELQFTKDQILQTYLNNVCFGCGIYGVEAASQRFWSKHAHELTISESALLAGIISAPARYCPLVYPLSAQKRRNAVLYKMKQCGYIVQHEYESALEQSVAIVQRQSDVIAPHVKEMLRIQLEELVGKEMLYAGGLRIQTTLNKTMQIAANKAFSTEIVRLRAELGSDIDGGLIALDTKYGSIKALVGGADFVASKFNRPVQARRQIGSCLKPLLYAAALDNGMRFTDTLVDELFEMLQQNGVVWKPHNFNGRYSGKMTLAYALSHSNNIVSIKTLLQIGAEPLVKLAKKSRIKGPFHYYPSLALGSIDGTLLEVAGMFNVFANDGVYVEPHLLVSIKNKWSTRIYKASPERERVLSSKIVGQVGSVLCLGPERIRSGQGVIKWVDSDVISKTGTTNDCRTCWYVGATPQWTTAVYIGPDDNRSMGKNVFPGKTALPIWRSFNRAIDTSQKHFSFDPSLQEVFIDEFTGDLSYPEAKGAIKILVDSSTVF